MQCTANPCVLTTTLRVPADAYAHPTSYAFACTALPPRKKKKNIKNCNSKTVCSTTTLRTFTMMCPPFHLKFLHSDFKSFNEPHIICGLSVTLKPTWCTSKLVYKTTTSRVLADAYAHPTSYAFACSALPPRTTIYT